MKVVWKIVGVLILVVIVQFIYDLYDKNQLQAALAERFSVGYRFTDSWTMTDQIKEALANRNVKITSADIKIDFELTGLGMVVMKHSNYKFTIDVDYQRRFLGIPYKSNINYYSIIYVPDRYDIVSLKALFGGQPKGHILVPGQLNVPASKNYVDKKPNEEVTGGDEDQAVDDEEYADEEEWADDPGDDTGDDTADESVGDEW